MYRRCMRETKYADAARFARFASDQGYAPGQYVLAQCYKRGWGVEKNLKEHRRLIRISASQWHPVALRDMHRYYSDHLKIFNEMTIYYYAVLYKLATGRIDLVESAKKTIAPVRRFFAFFLIRSTRKK